MEYFHSFSSQDGITYSLDKMVIDFKLKVCSGGNFSSDLFLFLNWTPDITYDHWETRKIGTFHDQFTFSCSHGNSFWMGVGLNSSGRVINRVRLEFNPNKVGNDYTFVRVFNRLLTLSSRHSCFVRFDLAVDIPVLRENVFLIKDARLYEECRYSKSNRTQYLGARNKPGRCKLYNKQIESNLDFPLTRFEITVSGDDMSPSAVSSMWPKIVIVDDMQMAFDIFSFVGIDRFIFLALMECPELVSELTRDKKKKFERILQQYTRTLSFDIQLYREIIHSLGTFSQLLPVNYAFDPFGGYMDSFDEI